MCKKCILPESTNGGYNQASATIFQENTLWVGGEGLDECKSIFQVDISLKQKLFRGSYG